MRRWLINIAAVLSVVLFVATVALWVRSYWITDTLYDTTERIEGEWYVRGSHQLFSNRGAFTFSRFGHWESMDAQPEYAQELFARRFGGMDFGLGRKISDVDHPLGAGRIRTQLGRISIKKVLGVGFTPPPRCRIRGRRR